MNEMCTHQTQVSCLHAVIIILQNVLGAPCTGELCEAEIN